MCREHSHLKLPTDLAGVTLATYDIDRTDRNTIAALSPASTLIRESIRSLGFKKSERAASSWRSRISLLGGITHEMESRHEQIRALKSFYRTILEELDRLPIGINNCGGEPIKELAIDYYSSRLYTHSKAQMEELNGKVRWYWRRGASHTYNYATSHI